MATDIAGPTKTAEPAPSRWKDITRFVTPYLLSLIISLAAKLGFNVTLVTAGLILTIGGTALGIVALIFEKWFPWVGAFLGYIGAPVYAPSKAKVKDAMISTLEAQVAELMAKSAEAVNPSKPTAAPVVTPVASEPSPAPVTPPVA